jgi:hypothetical protein
LDKPLTEAQLIVQRLKELGNARLDHHGHEALDLSKLPQGEYRPVKTMVDERFLFNPWTKRRVCGSFRRGKKKEYKLNKLTPEYVLKDQETFEHFICQANPATNSSNKSGRCRFHGADGGRPPTHGKYSVYLTKLTPTELAQMRTGKLHNDLNEELTLLSTFIREELPKTVQESASNADKELNKLSLQLDEAMKKMEFKKCRELTAAIREKCDLNREKAKSSAAVRQILQEYGKLFKIEIERRAISGEYMHKNDVVLTIRSLLTIVSANLYEDEIIETIRREFNELITTGNFGNFKTQGLQQSSDSGLNDQDEDEEPDYIEAEYSAEEVFDREPESGELSEQ